MGIAERIYELVKALPESAAAEVLDFAETKRGRASAENVAASRRTAALALLDKHAGRFKAIKFERADLHDRARLR